jgi:TrpR-related protein YerC/YecD
MKGITGKVLMHKRKHGTALGRGLSGVHTTNVRRTWIMSKKIHTEAVDSLFDAVLSLKNKEECYLFFEDVCTVNEILSLSQRFEVAKMLKEKRTYLEISEKTGASTATISRVNRSLNYGNDGYDMVFERIEDGK